METIKLINGDCLTELAKLPEQSIDTCITDPPYELGFMGKSWDSSGVAFDPNTWRAVYRVLKPGAFLLCFGGTRTFHRITCAIEDAGFEVRDCMSWLYGSGFPKSLNIAKAGAGDNWDGWGTALKPAWEPIIVAMKPCDGTFAENALRHGVAGLNIDGSRIPTTESLNGGAYAASGGRSPAAGDEREGAALGMFQPGKTSGKEYVQPEGRFPANLVLDEEAAAILDEQSGTLTSGSNCVRRKEGHFGEHGGLGKAGDVQTTYGDTGGASRFFYTAKASTKERWVHLRCYCETVNLSAWQRPAPSPNGQTDTTSLRRDTSEGDSATSSGSSMTQSGNSTTVRSPKATKSTTGTKTSKTTTSQTSNSSHRPSTSACTAGVKSGLASGGNRASSAINASPSTPSTGISPEKAGRCTGVVVDATSASSLKGSVCGVCGAEVRVEAHPTQKPLKLMEYLCTLTKTPTGGVVLDPFMGSGTTPLACQKTGRRCIGIERDVGYFEIAKKRLEDAPATLFPE